MKLNDPFGAAADVSMPQLAILLDRKKIEPGMKRGLRMLLQDDQVLRVKRVKVLRHKPGKRCVIEYRVFTEPPGNPAEAFSILGKIRANRSPRTAFELQEKFWRAGFDDHSHDRISVPEPIGMLEELQIWFQRKVKGQLATNLIMPRSGAEIAALVAEAACKIHREGVPTEKQHTIADELRILRQCFEKTGKLHPQLQKRLDALLVRCERIGKTLAGRPAVGIHRDFYSDQILVKGDRLYVLDFDLYCHGDPSLDIGNFLGHLVEQALRVYGKSNALQHAEDALRERFLELTSPSHRPAVEVYTNLTLARHVYLSSQFPDRAHLTEPLLALCEERIQ